MGNPRGGKRLSSTGGIRGLVKFAAFLFVLSALAADPRAIADGKAPGFALRDLSGRTVTLDEHRGRVVILEFWATWCMPCRMSIPELVELRAKYGGEGLSVLGVNMDAGERAGNDNLTAFKRKYEINYPILHSDENVVANYFRGTGPRLPTAFFIDREGNLRDVVVGYQPGALESSLKGLLN